jgi:hypothetical protein
MNDLRMKQLMCGATGSKRRVQNMALALGVLTNASFPSSSSCAGLTRLRGRSPFGEAKARASIHLRNTLSKMMDCRVKPGNDARV